MFLCFNFLRTIENRAENAFFFLRQEPLDVPLYAYRGSFLVCACFSKSASLSKNNFFDKLLPELFDSGIFYGKFQFLQHKKSSEQSGLCSDVASTRGFEPPTYRLGGGRSILLSYVDVT